MIYIYLCPYIDPNKRSYEPFLAKPFGFFKMAQILQLFNQSYVLCFFQDIINK